MSFRGVKALGPEDLRAGMYVSVLNHIEEDDDEPDPASQQGVPMIFGGGGIPVIQPRRPKKKREIDLRGQPLLVVDVSYPYVACLHTPDGNRLVVDARRVDLTQVSEQYVRFLVDERYYEKKYPGMFDDINTPSGAASLPVDTADELVDRGSHILDEIRDRADVADKPKAKGLDIDEIKRIMEE